MASPAIPDIPSEFYRPAVFETPENVHKEALRSIVSKATFEETKVSTWYAITAPTLHARPSSTLVARPRTIRLRSPASPFVR